MCIKVGIKKCSGANQPVVEMVRWTVVSPTHQGSNPGARIISGFISEFPAMRFQWEEMFPSTTRRLLMLKKSSMDGVEPPLHTSVTDELVQERVRTTWGRPCLYSICKVVSTWAGLHHPKINKRTRKGTGPHFGSNLEAESDGSDSYFHSKL